MIYLKTILTSKSELVLILKQIEELVNVVDKVIIIEPGFTHMGRRRELIFHKFIDTIPDKYRNKIIYIPICSNSRIHWDIVDEKYAHINENITRGAFVDIIKIKFWDIIISTDADEILNKRVVKNVIYLMRIFFLIPAFKFALKQHFFYQNWVVPNYKFIGPSIARGYISFFFKKYYRWRYDGILVPGFSGDHYSWCLSMEELKDKINNIAHAPQYGSNALHTLSRCIKDKVFYFRSDPLKMIVEETSNSKIHDIPYYD